MLPHKRDSAFNYSAVVEDELRLYTSSVGFKKKNKEKDGRNAKGQNNNSIQPQLLTKSKKNLFICQLKINYLAMYATILNNKTTKTAEQDSYKSE